MADPAVVAALLLDHCDAMVLDWPILSIAYPDVAFTPPENGKYLRIDFFRNAPFWQGLASGRIDQGILQVTVVWPRNLGATAPLEVAALVEAHFAKGTRLQGSGVTVKFNKEPWTASAIPDDSETLVPVTCSWVAV